MLASAHFKITKGPKDDWFDTILNADTRLFVDPFLIFKETNAPWQTVHSKIIGHFDHAFKLVADGGMNPASLPYRKALALLHFAEPREFCLGFTGKGTAGLGSGDGFSQQIAAAIVAAINRGLEHPKHFEELGILNEGIGRDRISDIALNIVKSDLITYTKEIAKRHNLPIARHRIPAASFDSIRLRWEQVEVELPTNPYTGGPVLFVPERFLRELPTLNADDWWDDFEKNQELRDDLNYQIMGKVDKATIVRIARENPEDVRRWTERREAESADAYDLKRDAAGLWQWDRASSEFAAANPLALTAPSNEADFFDLIEKVIGKFKLYVEDQGGWELLWNDSLKDKNEHAVQLLFRGIARSYCEANNISLDAEVNLGRGPVDFKFSNGMAYRAHLEIKKEQNGKFWNGLEQQLPSYMKSDEVKAGWFLAVRYRSSKASELRLRTLPTRVKKVADDTGYRLRFATVDARRPMSASKLKRHV